MVDDDCTFAALGNGVDDLVDPSTAFDKNDKFDTLLVKKKMSYDTISQVKACKDYKACKNQMGEPFGVIPLSPLLVYTAQNTSNNQVCDPLLAHRLVRQSGCPNFGVAVFQWILNYISKIGGLIYMIFGISNLWIYWNMVYHSILTGMYLFFRLKKIMLLQKNLQVMFRLICQMN